MGVGVIVGVLVIVGVGVIVDVGGGGVNVAVGDGVSVGIGARVAEWQAVKNNTNEANKAIFFISPPRIFYTRIGIRSMFIIRQHPVKQPKEISYMLFTE